MQRNKCKKHIGININNNGIALVTVLIIMVILSLLAVVAISTTGTDVINAGKTMTAQYNLNMANSSMNVVLFQLGSSQFTNSGGGTPVANVYYYTSCGIITGCDVQQSTAFIPLSQISLEDISTSLGFPGSAGYEYTGAYSNAPGYGTNYQFYNGTIYAVAQKNALTTQVTVGMTFNYGPVQVGYNQ